MQYNVREFIQGITSVNGATAGAATIGSEEGTTRNGEYRVPKNLQTARQEALGLITGGGHANINWEQQKHRFVHNPGLQGNSSDRPTNDASQANTSQSLGTKRDIAVVTRDSDEKDAYNSWLSGGSDDDHQTSLSLPERKREREKRRRELMNSKFSELALVLPRTTNGKADKETILAEAIENAQRQNNFILELNMQNQALKTEIEELRTEKSELRADKQYLRNELDVAREEMKNLRSERTALLQVFKQKSSNLEIGTGVSSSVTLEGSARNKIHHSMGS
eukprot:Plantae.Rhodophyta-Purpureofilum_apyrenoidigerum.ctg6677.p1 GENE.Plantae.Rhodophyta-Purpureofilum_apyrenoidigerum.ctg6677~~Plantae.Rhodophyta-Purpureofilum_apyrenoidigerum.ctg6677.p1  ORF type:complete len:279 (+),score=63.70 Plantae.Rhodophyta-Purpureofilum_apyrenoidigerum.ctg6677:176-1012(+)